MFDWLGRRWGVRCSSSQWVVCGFVGLVQVCGNINAQNKSPMAITGPVIVSMDLVKEQKFWHRELSECTRPITTRQC
jgi:hypothetical protein